MAPKRKRRASPPPKGLAPGELLKRFMLPSSSATPWSWVGSEVTDPSQITTEHMEAAYGFSQTSGFPSCKNKYASRPQKATSPPVDEDGDVIVVSDDDENPQCSKKACKGNPLCLNHLGQDVWESEAKARKLFDKLADIAEDPMLSSRDPDTPVGLKNLGATCYANSSLQVWFRDVAFRNGVYQCQVPGSSEKESKDFPIFNLQVTFAALQDGKQAVFNPTKLVESLQLRTAEQQDAQEFSKLFMSHLDAEFKKQSDPAVRDLIASQFQGCQVYGTICHSCKYTSERSSDFLEIEVNIKANSRLEDRIKESLEPEVLSKDNQYLCPQCDSLQDATRYTELRQLPPVLHFSLLRFIYDLSTMERKKSKHTITFPAVLDMGQFLGKADQQNMSTENSPSNIYELRGVLLHKGSSAYHGHYEAQVYDSQLGSWFQFNDDTVTKVSLFNDKNRGNKSTTVPASQEREKKNSRKKRRVIDSEEEEPPPSGEPAESTISSKDAYMLVYMRKDAVDPGASVPVPPPLALKVVDQLNDAHDTSCEEHEKRVATLKTEFQNKRAVVMKIYRNWQADTQSRDRAVVSQEGLRDWISKYCVEETLKPEPEGVSDGCEITGRVISNSAILCAHNKLNPDEVSEMKVITQDACDAIARETKCQFSPPMSVADMCEECIVRRFKERLYDFEHPRLVKEFEAVQEVDEELMEPGYWISKLWLRDWKLQKPRMHESSQGDPPPDFAGFGESVTCEHGGLTPNYTGRKRISIEAKRLLQNLYPDWDPPSTESEICAICQASISTSKEDKKELRKKAEEEKAKLKHMNSMAFRYFSSSSGDELCAIIPTKFYSNWKRWVDGPTAHSRPETLDTDALLCRHSMLLYDPNCKEDMDAYITVIRRDEWETLCSFYSAGPRISVQRKMAEGSESPYSDIEPAVCLECKAERSMNWDTAEITIQLSEPGKREQLSQNYASKNPSSVRHSRRLRNKQRDRRKVTVSKSTSLKDIKVEISEIFSIPTICQKLFFQDKELVDNDLTVEAIGIPANDVLYLEQITETMDIDSDSEPSSSRKPREEGQGFNGTILGGNMTDSSRASSEAPVSMSVEKPCKACTFANPAEATACEMCETVFD